MKNTVYQRTYFETGPGLHVSHEVPCPIEHELILIVPYLPDRWCIRQQYRAQFGNLARMLEAMVHACCRDQQTADGAPRILLAGWEGSLVTFERGQMQSYQVDGLPDCGSLLEAWLTQQGPAQYVLACGLAPVWDVSTIAAVAARQCRHVTVAARWCGQGAWFTQSERACRRIG